jgi:hypothetical protein
VIWASLNLIHPLFSGETIEMPYWCPNLYLTV